MYFVFQNDGVIDVDSIKTFGVSSKERPGAIGFFGTGLKYALAILLRSGCSVTIFAGEQKLVFTTERAKVRVDEFDFVCLNGERLGFTTELGKTWEMWQAFRELYCNCRDEGGSIFDSTPPVDGREGKTTIVVTGEAFHDVWADRGSVILEGEPIFKHARVHIHGQPSNFVYYRGVRAYQLQSPSLYTYDIQSKLDLSEDRTIKYLYLAQNAIRAGLVNLVRTDMVKRVVFAPEQSFEHDFDFAGELPGEVFMESVLGWKQARRVGMNPKAFEAIRPWVMERLQAIESITLTEIEDQQLDTSIDFLRRLGYDVRQYPITVTEHLGENILGMAEDGNIYLSRRVFMMGTKMLAGTLLEEYLHLTTGFRDGSRDLQNYLVDALMTVGERFIGEKL